MKCNLSTVNGWCGIFNRSCKEWTNSQCKFIKKAYRQGRVEGEYFGHYKSGWIPVSEGLPSEDGEYIVTMGKDGFDKEGSVTWAMFDKRKEGFYLPGGRVSYYIAVTAWMPLPEPYKGGDTE